MHELSIAQGIIDLVIGEAGRNQVRKVTRVDLEIGAMAGVEIEALLFAWETIRQGTLAHEASLVIDHVEARARCLACDTEFPPDNYLAACPSCGSYRYEIIKGRELRVSSFFIE